MSSQQVVFFEGFDKLTHVNFRRCAVDTIRGEEITIPPQCVDDSISTMAKVK